MFKITKAKIGSLVLLVLLNVIFYFFSLYPLSWQPIRSMLNFVWEIMFFLGLAGIPIPVWIVLYFFVAYAVACLLMLNEMKRMRKVVVVIIFYFSVSVFIEAIFHPFSF